jgi:surface protein
MFCGCISLTRVGNLDTTNGNGFYRMFYNCDSLTTVGNLDTSNGTDFYGMFYSCAVLENITFVGSINKTIDFKYCPNLTYDSIKSILTACAATTRTNAKTLSFKLSSSRVISDPNGEFAALIADCTTKGWTIIGLTLG